jgi:hypothetical protein
VGLPPGRGSSVLTLPQLAYRDMRSGSRPGAGTRQLNRAGAPEPRGLRGGRPGRSIELTPMNPPTARLGDRRSPPLRFAMGMSYLALLNAATVRHVNRLVW